MEHGLDLPELAQTIVNQGVLGILLVAVTALFVLYFLNAEKTKKRLYEELVKAHEQSGEIVNNNTTALTNWNNANETRTRLLEKTVQSQDLSVASQAQTNKAIEQISAWIQQLMFNRGNGK